MNNKAGHKQLVGTKPERVTTIVNKRVAHAQEPFRHIRNEAADIHNGQDEVSLTVTFLLYKVPECMARKNN